MNSKVQYNKRYFDRAVYGLHAIQENIKFHCNLHANNPKMLNNAIDEIWIPWIADAAISLVKAIK